MIAHFEFESGSTWLVRHDGWRYRLDGIYGMDMRYGFDGGYRDSYYTVRCHVTIPSLTVNNIESVQASLRVLREELPQDCELVVDTNY